MKSINEQFSEKEFEKLKKAKGDKTWRQFILDSAEVEDI